MAELGMPPPAQQPNPGALLAPLGEVAQSHQLAGLAARLHDLRAWLAEDLGALEAALSRVEADCQRQPGGSVGQAAAHLLGRRGKRIRPICALLAARLGPRPPDQRARDAAIACELVHAATLLHDDVIDEAQARRGADAARVVWGNSASILAGDHLLTCALRQALASGETTAIGTLLEVIAGMVAAEALQLQRRGRIVLERDVYLSVVRGKTAALFSWALAAGGRASLCDAATVARLAAIGAHLGTAFQLVDDLLDLQGDPLITGKQGLADLRQGKLTWPMLVACERDPDLHAELARLAALPEEGGGTGHNAQADGRAGASGMAWLARLRRTDAMAQTQAFAEREAALAVELIGQLPNCPAREALRQVVAAAVVRAT